MSEAPQAAEVQQTPDQPGLPTEFLVSSAPHLGTSESTRRIMFEVVLAMLPLLAAATIFYGSRALVLIGVTVAACLATEAVANAIRKRGQTSLSDGSAIVTGMILAFSLPPQLDLYMAAIGGAVAISLAKAIFGGLGQNLFNPAMVGRAFLMICFPAALGVWTEPGTLHTIGDMSIDGVTMATPLQAAADAMPSMWDLFVGRVGGCLGEASALAALIGGLYLVLRRVADWRPVVGTLAGAFVVILIAKLAGSETTPASLWQFSEYQLLAGAMMFGAFFISTDYVGAPLTPAGRLIFGLGVGALVMIIRMFGAYPEGFMFAILIMNALTPLIERITVPTPFGGHVVTA